MSQNTMTMKMMIEQAENDLLHTYNRYQAVSAFSPSVTATSIMRTP